jgi:hypothetical protein
VANQVYKTPDIQWFVGIVGVLVGASFLVQGVGRLADGRVGAGIVGGSLGLFAIVVCFYTAVVMPFEARFTESGVAFRAVTGKRVVRWPDLVSVKMHVSGGPHLGHMAWQPRDGRTVRTLTFKDVGEMFAEIARRSPETRLS